VNALLLTIIRQYSLIGKSNGGLECWLFSTMLPKQLANLKEQNMSQTNVLSSHRQNLAD
jgi:hypothetical protein